MPVLTNLIILTPYGLHREAWRALLSEQPGIQVSGAIEDISRAAERLIPDQANTILIDLPDPRPENARTLRTFAPHCGLLFLVQSYELSLVLPLLQAGATGFISRDASVGDLARAVIAAGRGEIVLPPEIAIQSLMALAQSQPANPARSEPLTERESEVLTLLAQGHTNKDIAQALFLSVRTVEAHLRSIFAKLAVNSRTEALLWAIQHGYSGRK